MEMEMDVEMAMDVEVEVGAGEMELGGELCGSVGEGLLRVWEKTRCVAAQHCTERVAFILFCHCVSVPRGTERWRMLKDKFMQTRQSVRQP